MIVDSTFVIFPHSIYIFPTTDTHTNMSRHEQSPQREKEFNLEGRQIELEEKHEGT